MTDKKINKLELLADVLRSLNAFEMGLVPDIFKRIRAENDSRKIVTEGIVIGTAVTFQARRRMWLGTVQSFGRNNKVKVKCSDGMIWTVPVSFLSVVIADIKITGK